MKLEDCNFKLCSKWSNKATELNAQLFFALAANEKNQTILLWDNGGAGNEPLIDYLKQVIKMLEQDSDKIIPIKL